VPPHPEGALAGRATWRLGRLAYGVAGDGPPVILLHGWPETRRAWRHVVPGLVDAGHRVIVPDLRGVGGSDRSPGADYSWKGYADDLDAVLAAEQVDGTAIVGHDMGGVVMFEWALRNPDRVDRLAALSTSFHRYDMVSSYYLSILQAPLLGRSFMKAMLGNRSGLARALRGNSVDPETFEEADIDAYLEGCGSPESRRAILAGYRLLSHNRRRREREVGDVRLDMPALVVWGTRDWALGDEGWKRITADLHQADVEILEAGHFLMEEQPARVTELLVDFLSPRVPGGRPFRRGAAAVGAGA